MERRSELKFNLFKTGKTQRKISQEIGISEVRLSAIIYSRIEPTEQEKKALSDFLKVSVEELFNSQEEGGQVEQHQVCAV